jgi:endoglucanase
MFFRKKKSFFSVCLLLLLSFTSTFYAQGKAVPAPFNRGVNLTGWFEIWQKGIPDLNKYTYQDFLNLKELGVDVIRLPVHFNMMLKDEKSGQVEDIVWDYLDKACDWAEELKIHLIIDNHSFNSGKYPSAKTVEKHLQQLWPQIAKRYKDRSQYILYEILNEPQISHGDWSKIQNEIVTLIRKFDKKHTIIVTGADWGGREGLLKLKPLSDKNLIYSFHYYDPFFFTHQGASWCDDAVSALKNIPFPYNQEKMPELEGAAKGSYLEYNFKNQYPLESSEEFMRKNLQTVVDFSIKNNVPVYVGEFGVYDYVSPVEDRNVWFETVGKLFQELGLPYTVWGYDSSFSFFEKDKHTYPDDLNPRILKALGFNVPEGAGLPSKKAEVKKELPLVIYEELFSSEVRSSFWSSNPKAAMKIVGGKCPQGKYYCSFSNMKRYESFTFYFKDIDLSFAGKDFENAYIHFYIKTESREQKIQLRFLNKDGENEIPWRLSYNLPLKNYEPGEWVLVEIPLRDFRITGAWSGAQGGKWYNPDKNVTFNWSKVERMDFAAEEDELKGVLALDDIKIIRK